jgi:hypothetical protein
MTKGEFHRRCHETWKSHPCAAVQLLPACGKVTGYIRVARVNRRPPVTGQQWGVILDAERAKSIVSDRMQRSTVVGVVGWYKYVFRILPVHGDTRSLNNENANTMPVHYTVQHCSEWHVLFVQWLRNYRWIKAGTRSLRVPSHRWSDVQEGKSPLTIVGMSYIFLHDPVSYSVGTEVLTLAVKRPGSWVERTPPSYAKFKNVWSCTSLSPVFMEWTGRTLAIPSICTRWHCKWIYCTEWHTKQ